MKKFALWMIVCLLSVLLCSSSWAALVHDARYHWKSGGTRVTQTFPSEVTYNVGDPTGLDLIEIDEKVFDLENGTARFIWTVFNDDFDDIYSFHVPSGGIPTVISHEEPDGWSFLYDGTTFIWETESDPFLDGGGSGLFKVVIPGTGRYAISTSAVNDYLGALHNEGGLWVASHPVPEPTTTGLLGLGLLGFIRVLRRKFKA